MCWLMTPLVKVFLLQGRCFNSGIQWKWDASENLVVAYYLNIQLHSSSQIRTIFFKWLWEAASTCKSIRNNICQWGQSAVYLPIYSESICFKQCSKLECMQWLQWKYVQTIDFIFNPGTDEEKSVYHKKLQVEKIWISWWQLYHQQYFTQVELS